MLLGDVRQASWGAITIQKDIHPFDGVIDE
jgi:hypothetical protein